LLYFISISSVLVLNSSSTCTFIGCVLSSVVKGLFLAGKTVCHAFCNEQLCAVHRLVGYEGLEVINPDGGTEDAEAEALRGRWKQEVRITEMSTK
jgi:hypothetical protein